MNEAERRRRALAAFREVVDLPVDQRAAWLEQHCAHDAQLIAQVLALLAADDREGEPFDGDARIWGQALHVSEEHEAHDAMLGRQLGAWRVLDVLGRGGMGAVYRVERDDGAYTQQAALKLIRASTDSQAARERFLRERQILAALRHPHIATLLDGGISPQGEPYFVMELIDGQPIDRWCDAHNLGLRERVTLFLQVLDAVRYAHRNLVVHRDLKPSNLMVDAEGRVKLLDFGIAKQLEGGAVTATHDRALTFEYASPEQLHDAPITTATDVWQLGVVLHRLLSGSHPFGLTRDTPLASQLQHLERDPEPLTRAAAKLPPEQALQRGGHTPASLSRALRGSLSAIVQTCLRRDPEARYATADALANDLQAWLDSRPIAAVPLRRMQRLRLWGRRNRTLAAAVAAVALALVAGTGVALWQAHEARAQARIATRESASARASLAFLTDTLAAAAPEEAMRRDVSVRDLLDQARRKLDEKSLDPQVQQSVQRMLGHVYSSLGEAQLSASLFEQGLLNVEPHSKEEAVALADDWIGYADVLGSLERARPSRIAGDRAARLRRLWAPEDPEQRFLAMSHVSFGDYVERGLDACEKQLREAIFFGEQHAMAPTELLGAYDTLAGVQILKGDHAGELVTAQRGLDLIERAGLPSESPHRISFLRFKGEALTAIGRPLEAEPVLRQAIGLQERTGARGTTVLVLYNALANSLAMSGDYREAAKTFGQVVNPSAESGAGAIAKGGVLANLALVQAYAGDYVNSLAQFDRAIGIMDAGAVPKDESFRRAYERNRATGLMLAGRYAEARSELQRLRDRARAVDGESSMEYAQTTLRLAVLSSLEKNLLRGEPLLDEAMRRLDALSMKSGPLRVMALRTQARFALLRGDIAFAEQVQRKAVVESQSGQNRLELAITQAELARTRLLRGDRSEAVLLLDKALPVMRSLVIPTQIDRIDAERLRQKL